MWKSGSKPGYGSSEADCILPQCVERWMRNSAPSVSVPIGCCISTRGSQPHCLFPTNPRMTNVGNLETPNVESYPTFSWNQWIVGVGFPFASGYGTQSPS